jgi:purine-binding chemotaxis protein CheW
MELAQTDSHFDGENKSNTSQYLTFMLDGEEYGIDILKVQGIQGYGKVTPLPRTPSFIRGVVNLRGAIVPIVDLRCRFGMEEIDISPTTVVIVVKVVANGKDRTVGLVVDAVSEVHDVADEELKPAPDFGKSANAAYIEALATINERMLILLNIDNLINNGVMDAVENCSEEIA